MAPVFELVAVSVNVPSYLNRHGFMPSSPEDFGTGGAFPEISVIQYPLGMGRKDSKPGSKILPVTVDSQGHAAFDAVVRQNENVSKIVYSQHSDLVPKILKDEEEVIDLDDDEHQKEIEEITAATKAAIEEIVSAKLGAVQPFESSKFIKYRPSQQSAQFNSGAEERIVRMVEMPVDPFEPPKFKHKRIPKVSGPPHVPVLHSPPRPVTLKDQQDWKIPPCVSNWTNPKGYVVPLDKRLVADGRGLQEVQISDNFAKFSEVLYGAEQVAREEVALRSKVQKEILMKENERRDRELKALAVKALSEKKDLEAQLGRNVKMDDEDEGRLERERIRAEAREERVREKRLEAKNESMGKKSKINRDRDRDISEKVALGLASIGAGRGEVVYDQRLFNQEKGMESGFATDDQYNVYDKGLFTAQATMSTLYQPRKDVDADVYGGADEQLEKIKDTKRFKPDRAFTGTSETGGLRDTPVEYEEADPFELNQWFTEVKTGVKDVVGVGRGGTMKESGGWWREGDGGASKRSRINFERGN